MDLTTSNRDLGLRWAHELIRRGLLVNPNEKFYISIAHTEADVTARSRSPIRHLPRSSER